MINFNKNKLINKTLDKYYETFSHTLDTADYVPDKFNDKISKFIYKNMKKTFKQIDKEDRQYQQELKKQDKLKLKQHQKAVKPKSKLVLFFQKLFNHKQRRKVVKEKADYFSARKINECDSTSALDKVSSETNSCDTNTKQ